MQLDEWDEKPANGQSTLVRQISADAFCVNHMRDRRRKDTLQADEATLSRILHKHCVLLSQLLLKKLSKRLEQAVISNVEVCARNLRYPICILPWRGGIDTIDPYGGSEIPPVLALLAGGTHGL